MRCARGAPSAGADRLSAPTSGCLPKPFFDAGDPVLGADWPGGFRCPCHGSRFDLAGRVFNGSPAPTNLVVPPVQLSQAEHTLVIGSDDGPAQGAA